MYWYLWIVYTCIILKFTFLFGIVKFKFELMLYDDKYISNWYISNSILIYPDLRPIDSLTFIQFHNVWGLHWKNIGPSLDRLVIQTDSRWTFTTAHMFVSWDKNELKIKWKIETKSWYVWYWLIYTKKEGAPNFKSLQNKTEDWKMR